METLHFTFKGIRVTNQENNTHHLILIVKDDIQASIVYSAISASNTVSLSYAVNNNFFDLNIVLTNTNQIINLTLRPDEVTQMLPYQIDNSLITYLWVCYELEHLLHAYNSMIPVLPVLQ